MPPAARTRPAAFRQVDVKRIVAGVRAAGLEPEEVIITPSGSLRIRIAGRSSDGDSTENEINKHFEGRWSQG